MEGVRNVETATVDALGGQGGEHGADRLGGPGDHRLLRSVQRGHRQSVGIGRYLAGDPFGRGEDRGHGPAFGQVLHGPASRGD